VTRIRIQVNSWDPSTLTVDYTVANVNDPIGGNGIIDEWAWQVYFTSSIMMDYDPTIPMYLKIWFGGDYDRTNYLDLSLGTISSSLLDTNDYQWLTVKKEIGGPRSKKVLEGEPAYFWLYGMNFAEGIDLSNVTTAMNLGFGINGSKYTYRSVYQYYSEVRLIHNQETPFIDLSGSNIPVFVNLHNNNARFGFSNDSLIKIDTSNYVWTRGFNWDDEYCWFDYHIGTGNNIPTEEWDKLLTFASGWLNAGYNFGADFRFTGGGPHFTNEQRTAMSQLQTYGRDNGYHRYQLYPTTTP